MPLKFYISRPSDGSLMKLKGREIIWLDNYLVANSYDSKYAAKRHAKEIGLEEYRVRSDRELGV